MSLAPLIKVRRPLRVFFFVIIFLPLAIYAQNSYSQQVMADNVLICINNISINEEINLRGLSGHFPYPVISTISVLDSFNKIIVTGLADTSNWLGVTDIAENGRPISQIWQPVLEYHEHDPLTPNNPDTYHQIPKPLFTEIRANMNFPTSTMLVMDASYSMKKAIADAKNAVLSFIHGMRPVDSAGVVVFDHEIKAYQTMTNDQTRLTDIVEAAQSRGKTALYEALMFAIRGTKSASGRRGIVVYADGEDNSSKPEHSAKAVIDSARAHNIPIYTIAFNDSANTDTLKHIALMTGGLFLKTTVNISITDIYSQLYKAIQNFYVMAHASPDPEFNRTWRVVDVKAYFENRFAKGRGFYYVGGPPDDMSTDLTLDMSSKTDTTIIVEPDTLNAIRPGEMYEYNLTIENIGQYYAKDVTLVQHLPDSVRFIDASIQPIEINKDSLVWKFPIFQVSRSEHIIVSVQLASEVPQELETLSSEAILYTANNTLYERDVVTDTVGIIHPEKSKIPENYDLSLSQLADTDTTIEIEGLTFPAVLQGDSLSYTLNIKNYGPGTAYQFEVQNIFSDSVSVFNINPAPSVLNRDTLFWQVDSLLSGDSVQISFEAHVFNSLPVYPFPLVNTCRVIAKNDTLAENNISWLTIYAIERKTKQPAFTDIELLLTSQTDTFKVIKDDTLKAVNPNDEYSYQLAIRNLGLIQSDSMTVFFNLPDSVQLIDASVPAAKIVGKDVLEWHIDELDPQQQLNIQVNVKFGRNIPTELIKLISSAQLIVDNDSLLTNNLASDTIHVIHSIPEPRINYDLAISQHTETDTVIELTGVKFPAVLQGESYQYFLKIKNFGPVTARNLTVVNHIADSVMISETSFVPIIQERDSILWMFDSLTAGDSILISFRATSTDSLPYLPFPFINTCELNAEYDTLGGNNRTETLVYGLEKKAEEPVEPALTDVSIIQSVSTNMMINLSGETVPAVFIGNRYFYTILLRNESHETAYNIQLLNNIPDSVNVSDFSQIPSKETSDSLFWQFDSLRGGDSIKVAFQAKVTDTLPFTPYPLLSACEVVADNDSLTSNNRFITTAYAIRYNNIEKGLTDLDLKTIVKTDTVVIIKGKPVNALKPGDIYDYNLVIRNIGQNTADSVSLFLNLPDSVHAVEMSLPAQTMTNESLKWHIEEIIPQQVVNIAVKLHLSPKSPESLDELINSALIVATNDSSQGNNVSMDTLLVIHHSEPTPSDNYDLFVKQHVVTDTTIEISGKIKPAVVRNEHYRYDLSIVNNGPAIAHDVVVRNHLPEFIAISEINPAISDQAKDTLFWQIGSLDSGDSTLISFQLVVSETLPYTPYPLINICEIIAAKDTTSENNISADTVYAIETQILPPVDWEPSITAVPSTVNVGEKVRIEAQTSISVQSWDIWVHFANGSIDSTYADQFINSTPLKADHVTEVEPLFIVTRLYTQEVQEQMTFELLATDSTGITKSARVVVNVLDDGILNFDKNIFRPDQDNNLEIKFKLITDSEVQLEIYDIAGVKISTLAETQFTAGWNTYNWYGHIQDGKKIGSGVYIITMRSKVQNAWKKLLIVR